MFDSYFSHQILWLIGWMFLLEAEASPKPWSQLKVLMVSGIFIMMTWCVVHQKRRSSRTRRVRMCSLDGQLGDVSLTYIPVADYRGLEGCCTSGAVQFKLLKPIHIFNLYCNSFICISMRYTTVTMIDDRRGFAWSEPLQKRLESYTFSWRNVGNHWGCFTSHGLWDRPPGTMAWCNGSDTRSIEYWVALREVWFDFLAYRVNDFDFESGLDTHVVVQIPDLLVDYWDVLLGMWCDWFPVWMQPRHEQRWMPGLRRQKAGRQRCVGRFWLNGAG